VVCTSYRDKNCEVAQALNAISEQWSPQIFQEALFNETAEFGTFAANLGIPPDTLFLRLNEFVASGLMERRQNAEHPNRQEYVLTEKGRDLAPTMIALALWGERWNEQDGTTIVLEQNERGGIVEHLIRCDDCEEDPPHQHPHSQIESDAVTEVLIAPLDTEQLGNEAASNPVVDSISICLLGAFSVHIAGAVTGVLSTGAQRILAFLAIRDRAVTRLAMAGTMWPDVSEQHAGGSLRSALSRLDQPTREAILLASAGLRLDDEVIVDFRDAKALAQRLVRAGGSPNEADLSSDAVDALSQDLLPDWYDEWVVSEAENWRYLRRNALEAQTEYLLAQDRWAEASGTALAAIEIDPLRESSQACFIRVHLARGNQSEALKVYNEYSERLMRELGLEPTSHLSDLVVHIQRS
jgi:DNA-binding SARP family transcriptional activator/DNA-binding HxlR family transcriptional regulator